MLHALVRIPIASDQLYGFFCCLFRPALHFCKDL
jgi:hypothetical protein